MNSLKYLVNSWKCFIEWYLNYCSIFRGSIMLEVWSCSQNSRNASGNINVMLSKLLHSTISRWFNKWYFGGLERRLSQYSGCWASTETQAQISNTHINAWCSGKHQNTSSGREGRCSACLTGSAYTRFGGKSSQRGRWKRLRKTSNTDFWLLCTHRE